MNQEPAESGSREGFVVDRRALILGAAATGLLAACGQGVSEPSESPDDLTAASDVPERQTGLALTSDVPEGGGLVVPDKWVVITQPTAGDFHAFSAICTHQGCTVSEVTPDKILCPCHGSQYSSTTGEVLRGPAPLPLEPIVIEVKGDRILNSPKRA
ncbi:MAG: Rieske (2Fe-2S) protein [Candidatus Nanopelagicales bacterium]|nr:Rieske (2Fe-2S) protein [Candidatus Nanopelagicales bacterium]